MSFVLIAPEFVTAAAGDLTNLGSSISAANASAASATTQVLAAGADEVSARIAALFGGFGLEYQAISAQVAAYHQRFVQALSTGAGAYASAEAAAAEQIVLGVINAPTQALLGRPLIGDGANATTPGGAGGAGGLLFGNGGAGAAGAPGQAGGAGRANASPRRQTTDCAALCSPRSRSARTSPTRPTTADNPAGPAPRRPPAGRNADRAPRPPERRTRRDAPSKRPRPLRGRPSRRRC
ncbi:PE PGRS family protein [Mycobacterium tuberculosis]|nr:PE PGRS family protein [Mycobacterium tuberculosis]